MRKVPRILGLIIAAFIAGMFLFIFFGSLFNEEPITKSFESVGIVGLTVLTTISVIVAWFKIEVGAWMVLASGILFAIFGLITAGQNRLMAVMAAGGPLLLSSLLMLWGMQLEKRTEPIDKS